jgi:hypothetical protein
LGTGLAATRSTSGSYHRVQSRHARAPKLADDARSGESSPPLPLSEDDLPEPDVLAQEIADDMQTALEQFSAIADKLKG